MNYVYSLNIKSMANNLGVVEEQESIVQILNSNSYTKIVEYKSVDIDSAHNKQVLLTPKTAEFREYVEYSIIFDKNSVPISIYGEDRQFEDMLLIRSSLTKLLKGLTNFTIGLDNRIFEFTLIGSSDAAKLTRRTLYSDALAYISVKEYTKSEFQNIFKLNKLATVDSMKERYNCSWVFECLSEEITSDKLIKRTYGKMIKDYKSITTMEDLKWVKEVLNSLPDGYYTGYDVETSGTKIYYMPDNKEAKSRILGLSISWEDNQAVYIPCESKVFECLTIDQIMNELYPDLCRLGIIAHNGQFEWKVHYDIGRTLPIKEDTMLLEYNISSIVKQGWRTLKNLTRMWFNHETWEFEQLFGGKADPEMLVYLPLDLITIYGCADADYARMLYFKLVDYLNDKQAFCYNLDCAIIELLAKAEYYGLSVDKREVVAQEHYLKEDMQVLLNIMNEYITKYGWVKYKQRRIIELYTTLQENSPELTRAEMLEILNDSIDEEDIRKSFTTQIKTLLKENPYNSEKKLSEILYKILEYPVLRYITPSKALRKKRAQQKQEAILNGIEYVEPARSPATDEEALNILKTYELDESSGLFDGNLNHSDPLLDKPLLDAGKLNHLKYPLVEVLLEYKRVHKLLSTFFKNQKDSKSIYLYNENLQCQAKTARIISTAQTISKESKRMVINYPRTWGLNADYSQIEIRNMTGCANAYWKILQKHIKTEELSVYHRGGLDSYVRLLDSPETDIHTETAARTFRVKRENVSSELRSLGKAYSFGLPYGRGAFSITAEDVVRCVDALSDSASKEMQIITVDGGIGVMKWNFENYPIYMYLESVRQKALTLLKTDETGNEVGYTIKSKGAAETKGMIHPYYKGKKISYVENVYGRRRVFVLDDIGTNCTAEDLRKEGGNFPIQSGSRDLFFMNKINLYNAMKKEGLVNNPTDGSPPMMDKFTMVVFVHDEFYGYGDLKLHPYVMLKLVYENCFVKIKNHPTYFMGVNFVNTWHDGKVGTNELPVPLVKELATMDRGNWPKYMDGYFYIPSTTEDGKEIVTKYWTVDYFSQLKADWEHKRVCSEIVKLNSGQKYVKGDESNLITEIDYKKVKQNLESYYVKALLIDVAEKFGAKKKDGIEKCLKVLWDNRNFNYVQQDVKDTHYENTEESANLTWEDLTSSEREEDLLSNSSESPDLSTYFENRLQDTQEIDGLGSDIDLFSTEENLTSEFEDVIEAKNLKHNSKDIEEVNKVKEYMTAVEHFSVQRGLKERDKYVCSNLKLEPLKEEEVRIIEMLSGKIILDINDVKVNLRSKLIRQIQELYSDPNGSIIEILENHKVTRLPFRVFSVDKNVIVDLLNAYKD